MSSILVETGYAGLDGRHDVRPDFVASDLAQAVGLILDGYPRLLALCEELVAEVDPGAVIQVTGLPRDGMTTFATGIRHVLEARGLVVQSVDLDTWQLAPESKAGAIPANLDVAALQARASGWLKSGAGPQPDAVTVIEGTAGLYPEMASFPAKQRFLLHSDRVGRRGRVLRKLELWGFDSQQAERILSVADDALAPLADSYQGRTGDVSLDGVLS